MLFVENVKSSAPPDDIEMRTEPPVAMETNVPSTSTVPIKLITRDKPPQANQNQVSGAKSPTNNHIGDGEIHEDLRNLVLIEGQLDGATSTTKETAIMESNINLEEIPVSTVPCLTPVSVADNQVTPPDSDHQVAPPTSDIKSASEKPTSLDLKGEKTRLNDLGDISTTNDLGDIEQPKKSKKADAFDFVTDLITQAKSPTSSSPPVQIGSCTPPLAKKGPKVVKPNASAGSPRMSTSRSIRQAKSKSLIVDISAAKTKSTNSASKDDLVVNNAKTVDKNTQSKTTGDTKWSATQNRATRSSAKSAGRPKTGSRSGSGPRTQERSNSGQRPGSATRSGSGQWSGSSPKPNQGSLEKRKNTTKAKNEVLSSSPTY